MKIYVYARMSSNDESKLQKQIDSVLWFCQSNGFTVSRVFKEMFSGYFKFQDYSEEERKSLAELMKCVKSGDLIIMQSVSRLSRQGSRFVEYVIDYITKKGANIYFIIEDIFTSRENKKMILQFADEATKHDYKSEELKNNGRVRRKVISRYQQQGKKIDDDYMKIAVEDYIQGCGNRSKTMICKKYKVSRPTFDKYLTLYKENNNDEL
jgi:DNA invertase Pin-like site-specific DNA recombinase